MLPKTITVAWLQRRRACADRVEQFKSLYPDGLAVTAANARAAHEQGFDVIWACCHLMTQAQRRAFILFTLRQRQPSLVTLFERAGLTQHARAIQALTWDDLAQAQRVLGAARAATTRGAAGDAAWGAAGDAIWAAAWGAVGDAWCAAGGERAIQDAQVEECTRILGLR